MIRNRFVRVGAAACVLALTAAACSSDSDGESAATNAPAPTPTEADAPVVTDPPEVVATDPPTVDATDPPVVATDPPADPLGEPNPATGEPLEVVYMWSGVSPAVDNSSDLAAAKAMTQWINEYGGGIGPDHRELVLTDCAAPDSAIAAACGSTILESGVPIVLFNVIGDVATWATPTLAAGIPILAYSSADASLRESPDLAYTLSNPISGLGQAPATLAKALGLTKSVVDVINVPAAVGPAQALSGLSFTELGAGEVAVIPIDPTAPDHGPDVQAALQNGPELWHIVGNPAFCSLSIRALRDAQFEGTISGISNCLDSAIIEQLGADIEGIYLSYSGGEDPANADYARFLEIIAKYDDSITPHGTPVGASIVMEGFRRLMEDYDGDYTSASIGAHIRNHGPLPLPSMDGATMQCNSTALALIPIACTSSFAYAQLDAEGNPGEFTYVK